MDSGDPGGRNNLNYSLCDNLCKITDLRNPCNMRSDM